MAITKIEYLDDMIRVHTHFRQPDGVLDDDIIDIPYESLSALQQLPEGKKGEELFLAGRNRTIVLVENSWPETSYGKRMYEYQIYVK